MTLAPARARVDLSRTSRRGYHPGRGFGVRAAWLIVEAATLLNPLLTSYRLKAAVLRAFGARIGAGVVIKPGVHVKYPWRLSVGENAWLGERAWIDNMGDVEIGANACISQGAYVCTGNHDWSDPGMGLVVAGVAIEDGAWIGAFARVAPGVRVRREAVLTLGSVATRDLEPATIYAGQPAVAVRKRVLGD